MNYYCCVNFLYFGGKDTNNFSHTQAREGVCTIIIQKVSIITPEGLRVRGYGLRVIPRYSTVVVPL